MKDLEIGMNVKVVALPAYVNQAKDTEVEDSLLGSWVTVDKLDRVTESVRISTENGKTYWIDDSKLGIAATESPELGAVYASEIALRDGHTITVIAGLKGQPVLVDDVSKKVISAKQYHMLTSLCEHQLVRIR